MSSPYKFYAFKASLYSAKLRPWLKYKKVPFVEISSSRRLLEQKIVPKVGKFMIPVLETPDGQMFQDTTKIIETFEHSFTQEFGSPSVYPETPKQALAAMLLGLFGDEWLLMPAMHYRWNRRFWYKNLYFVLREFGSDYSPHWPSYLHPIAGIKWAKYFGQGHKITLGCDPAMASGIETMLTRFLTAFDRHLESYPFALGNKFTYADLGLIGPLYAHLGRDPYPKALLQRTAPNVMDWIERVNDIDQYGVMGELPANDEVPETLTPIFELIAEEFLPVLLQSVLRVEQYIKKKPEREQLPRYLGNHEFKIGGVQWQRMTQSFLQWQLQRPLMFYQGLPAKTAVDRWLKSWGGFEFLLAPLNYFVVYQQPHTCKSTQEEAYLELPVELRNIIRQKTVSANSEGDTYEVN